MHGLRGAGYAPGWTRLLDEWILGFEEPLFPEAEERALTTLGAVRHSLGDAARRVRWLAGKGEEAVDVGPAGELRFEVAEYDYIVVVKHLVLEDLELFADAVRRELDEACAAAKSVMGEAEGSGVGVVITTPKTEPLDAEACAAFLATFRERTRDACEESAHGGAWILPGLGQGAFGEANVSDTFPGISLLYRAFGEIEE